MFQIGVIASSIKLPVAVSGTAPGPMLMRMQGYEHTSLDYQWTNNLFHESFLTGTTTDSTGNIFVVGQHDSDDTAGKDILLAKYAPNGTILWQRTVKEPSVSSGDDLGSAVTSDTAGNSYVFGRTETSTGTSATAIKYSPSGTLLWQKKFNTTDSVFHGAVTDGTSHYAVGSQVISGEDQMLLVKLDAAGSIVWQKTLAASGGLSSPQCIALDPSGNIVVGYVINTDSSLGFAKYSSTGTLLWSKAVMPSYSSAANNIAVDTSGNIYASYDGDLSSSGLIKLDSNGDIVWSRTLYLGDGTSNWYYELTRSALAVDGTDLYVVAAMKAYQSSAVYVIKMDGTGAIVEQRMLNEGANAYPSTLQTHLSVKLANGLLYVAGDEFVVANRDKYNGIFCLPLTGEGVFDAASSLSVPTHPAFVVKVTAGSDTQTSPSAVAPIVQDVTAVTGTMADVSTSAPEWMAATVSPFAALTAGANWLLSYGDASPTGFDVGGLACATDGSGNTIMVGYKEGSSPDAFMAKISPTGTVVWDKTITGPSNYWDDYVVKIDAANNIYIFTGDNYTGGVKDATIMKFNSSGAQQWQKTITSSIYMGGMALDSSFIYVGGKTATAPSDCVVMKLNLSDGALVAQTKFGTSANDYISAMAIASDGSLLITGATFVSSSADLMTLKMPTSLASITWQRQLGTTAFEYSAGIFGDTDGSIYNVGDSGYSGTNPSTMVAFHKYDSAGIRQFSRTYGDTSGMFVTGTNANANRAVKLGNNIYICGAPQNNSQIHGTDIVVMKFNLAGDLIWSKTYYTAGENGDEPRGISTDGTNLFIAGRSTGDDNHAFLLKIDAATGGTNGTYGRFTIEDYAFTEYTTPFTDVAGTFGAPTTTTFTLSDGTHVVADGTTLTSSKTAIPPAPPAPAAGGIAGVRFADGENLFVPALDVTDNGYAMISFWINYSDDNALFNGISYVVDPDNAYATYHSLLAGGANSGCAGVAFQGNTGDYEKERTFSQLATGLWNHFLIAFKSDATSTKLLIYLNGALDSVNMHHTGSPFVTTFGGVPFYVGSDGYSYPATFDMADFWLDIGTNFFEADGTISSATLAKFIDTSGKPVDLGSTGQNPMGSAPAIFLHRDAAAAASTFANNLGTGGAFTLDAALDVSPTNPGD